MSQFLNRIYLFSCFSTYVLSDSIFLLSNYRTIKIVIVLCSGYFLHLLLLQHGGIESNPWSKKEQNKYTSCCHWNVNSLLAKNMLIISQIEPYNSLYSFDFICISETCFGLSILEAGRNFQLCGYHLIRADHPSNEKRFLHL